MAGFPDTPLMGRALKKRLGDYLLRDDVEAALKDICGFPLRRVVNALFPYFYDQQAIVKWRAVAAMGRVVARLADENPESARVVMRRLMWNLNDESGGIGWGSPEAMGEIMACSEKLADEYAAILKSYICRGKNFIEYGPLQRGVIWGLGRLAQARPGHVRGAAPDIAVFLGSDDPFHRGFAAWTLGSLKSKTAAPGLERLLEDHVKIKIYLNKALSETTVGKMAEDALAKIEQQ